eukprot:sb/3473895/
MTLSSSLPKSDCNGSTINCTQNDHHGEGPEIQSLQSRPTPDPAAWGPSEEKTQRSLPPQQFFLTHQGLRLSNSINSTRSSTILNKVSTLLLNERLKHYRSSFATTDRVYKESLSRLLPLLTEANIHLDKHILERSSTYRVHLDKV